MDDISKLQRDRNRVIAAMGIIFLVWQGASLARDLVALFHPESAEAAAGFADLVEAVGAISWVLATLAMLALGRRVRRAEAQDVLKDELFQHNQSRALKFGFKAMVGLLVLLMAGEAFFDLTAGIAIRSMMIVAVIAPLGAFVVLSGGSDEAAA